MGNPICSNSGDIVYQVYAQAGGGVVRDFPDIYKISETREIKKIAFSLPFGYKEVQLQSLYAAPNAFVALLEAFNPKGTDPNEPEFKTHYFLSFMDEDGGRPHQEEIHLSFTPMKVAAFESGEVLVLGMDTINLQPVLALLNPDGSFARTVDLDSRTYKSSKDLAHAVQPKKNDSNTYTLTRQMQNALGLAMFVPWGTEVLFVQPGAKLPVYRLTSAGVLDAVDIELPDGFLMASILGSSEKDPWVVTSMSPDTFTAMANFKTVENAPGEVFEVDPFSGKVLDQLTLKGPQPSELNCAAHGKLTSIYYGFASEPNKPDALGYASGQR